MRKVTNEAVKSFFNCKNFKRSNTEIEVKDQIVNFYLHGNTIATLNKKENKLFLYHAGWRTNTTKERLNGILGFKNLGMIFQKNWIRYFTDLKDKNSTYFDHVLEFSL